MIRQKKSKKNLQKNSNQLELDFSEKEVVVDIKIPKASVNNTKQQTNNKNRLVIQLADN